MFVIFMAIRRLLGVESESESKTGRESPHIYLVEQHADDQREERCPFDQRRRDQHRCLDVTGHFRLPSHALHGLRANVSDPIRGTHNHQAGAKGSTEVNQARRCSPAPSRAP